MIVGAIKEHRTSQHWDRARRSQRRTHGDGESARAAAAGDGECVERKRCEQGFFYPTVSWRERPTVHRTVVPFFFIDPS
jgi:hypothetical protein